MKTILLVVFVALVAIAFGETLFPPPPPCQRCGWDCERTPEFSGCCKCRNPECRAIWQFTK